jgi:hypothetical protein
MPLSDAGCVSIFPGGEPNFHSYSDSDYLRLRGVLRLEDLGDYLLSMAVS